MRDPQTLRPIFEGLAAHGDRPALIRIGQDGQESTSYATLAANVARYATGIRRQDLGKGRPVGLFANSGSEWLEACLALIGAGATPVPLDMQLDTDALGHILADCGARAVVSDRERAEKLESIGYTGRIVLLDDPASERSWCAFEAETAEPFADCGADDTAILFYTSGTTGRPKGVPLSQRNVAFQLEAVFEAGLVGRNDRILQPLPLHHVYPLVVGTLVPLSLGLPIVSPEAMLGPQIITAIRAGGVTFVIGVPRLYRALLEGIEARIAQQGGAAGAYLRSALRLSTWLRRRAGLRLGKGLLKPLHARLGPGLRVLASGGAALDPDVAWRLEGLGWQVAIGYGLTETSPLLTINPPGNHALESVGRPAPGIEIRIDCDTLDAGAAEGGEPQGEIQARGPGVFRGYLRDGPATSEAFTADGWFKTGDLGLLDAAGRLFITGRKSTLIVTSSGKNIQPDDLEARYAAHPCIDEIGIVADGDHLAAVIKPAIAEIRRRGMPIKDGVHLALVETGKQLPSYKQVTRHVLCREPLARTRLGKIKRHELAARYTELAEAPDQGGDKGAPLEIDEMQAADRALLEHDAVRAVWKLLARNYPKHGLTPDASMQMDLGIDSLGWLGLSTAIAERAGVQLDEERIGEIDTVRDLLTVLAESGTAEGGRESPLENPAAVLTEQQLHSLEPQSGPARSAARFLYGLNRVLGRTLFGLRVEGLQDLPADAQLLFAPNHTSFLDAFAVAASLPSAWLEHTYWAGWTGYAFRNRLFSAVSRLVHIVPVDAERAASSSLAFAAYVLERGDNLVWFPEGGRSPDGQLLDFKPGIGMLLEHFPKVHVVPTYIRGAYEAWPRDRAWPRLTRITVTFGAGARGPILAERGRGETGRDRIVSGLEAAVRALAE